MHFSIGWLIPFFVKLTLDYCEVSAPMLKPIGLVAVGWMVMALKVQCYWGPPVFGHYKVDDPVAVGVLRYLQTFKIMDRWCADDMVEHVGGQGLASGGGLGQCVGLFILGPVDMLQSESLELSLETSDGREVLHECGEIGRAHV